MAASALIPLFPLELVLYPRELLPLHVFEQRYRDLVKDCMSGSDPFGVVLFQDGRMAGVGCTARIREVVRRYEDGRMDIVVEGEDRFRIRDVNRQRSYLRADAEALVEPADDPATDERERVITQHIKLLELAGRIPSPSAYSGHEWLSYFIALNAGLSLEQKQEMLELPGEHARVLFLIQHLAEFIPRVEEAETLRRKIGSNGHFPDFPPDE